MTSPPPGRLDSWKAIAEYLQRDAATVRRWERTLGLPVRRVAGVPGRSVFAYTAEIDAWLQTTANSRTVLHDAGAPAAAPMPRSPWRGRLLIAAVFAAAVTGIWVARPPSLDSRLQYEASPEGVVALDETRAVKWRYAFPPEDTHVLLAMDTSLRVFHDRDPMVLVATGQRLRRTGGVAGGGVLRRLTADGREQRSFAFDDEVSLRGQTFGAPWALTSYDVEDGAAPRRIAVAAHHWTWEPSLVTILDANWTRRGTFVHAGWIEQVRWLASDRLLVGGFSNPRDGGVVGLLDPSRLDGQGSELKLVVMPRSEVNLAAAAPFNRVLLEVAPGRILARTVEVPNHNSQGAADAIYEFTTALDLISARFSERYWDAHRALEADGRLDHTRAQCRDRDGPRTVAVWDPGTGWRTVSRRDGSAER